MNGSFIQIFLVTCLLVFNTAQAQNASTYRVEGTGRFMEDSRHGKSTASGKLYDRTQLSAAHPTLPIGSTVRVKNLFNGKTLDLKVIDRKVPKDSVVQVSRAAAQKLGMFPTGIARVEVSAAFQNLAQNQPKPTSKPAAPQNSYGAGAPKPAKPNPQPAVTAPQVKKLMPVSAKAAYQLDYGPPAPPERFRVQFGAFGDARNAQRMQQALQSRGISAEIQARNAAGLYRVTTVHSFDSQVSAQSWARETQTRFGFDTLVAKDGF